MGELLMRCFNGHPMNFGVPNCPICGATPNDDVEEPIENNDYEKALITLEQQNEILLKWIVNIRVTNKEERKNCSDMLTNARDAKRNYETALKEATEPAREEIEKIKAKFNPFIEKIATGIDAILKVMTNWDNEQDRLAREALEQAKQDQVDQITGEVVSVITEPIIIPGKTTRSHVGSDTRIESFDVVITDAKLVPREYCDPSIPKLRAGFKLFDVIPGALKVPKNIYQTRRKT